MFGCSCFRLFSGYMLPECLVHLLAVTQSSWICQVLEVGGDWVAIGGFRWRVTLVVLFKCRLKNCNYETSACD